MNVRHTSALFLILSSLASSLSLAAPQISIRSQGQNIVHTTIQQTTMHIPLSEIAVPVNTAPVNTAPVNTVLKTPSPVTTAATLPASAPVAASTLPSTPVQEKMPPTNSEKSETTFTSTTPSVTPSKQPQAAQKDSLSATALTTKNSKKTVPKKLKDTPSTLITPVRTTHKITPALTDKVPPRSPFTAQANHNAQTIKNAQTPTKKNPAQNTQGLSKTPTRKTLHNSTPIQAQSRPVPKKIQPKNKKASSSTTTPIFESYPSTKALHQPQATSTAYTYPALDNSLKSLPAIPVFHTCPTIGNASQSCSTKTFEIYPTLQDSTQPKQSQQKSNPIPSVPVIKKTPTTKPIVKAAELETHPSSLNSFKDNPTQENNTFSTQLIVQATPQEEVTPLTPPSHWIDRTKKLYEKGATYFKDLFSQKNSTRPLSNAVLHSQNAAMEVHSVDNLEGSLSDKNISGNFTVQTEVMRSFKPHALTRALFGCDLYNNTTINVRGSALARNEKKDWLADYFYLSNNYEGMVCFTPRVTSFLADLSLFIDLNSWFNGCFLRVQSPLTWTKWDLGMREQIINSGNVTGAQGWRGNWTSVDTKVLSSFTDYSCWEKAGTSYVDSVGLAYPLYAAKLCPCGRATTELADIHVDFGVYAHEGERYHVGLYARGVMPTGTKPNGKFLFEPIVGNGHYWELGGGVNGYAQLWRAHDKAQEVGLYLDGSITHLFSSHQQRVFDLKGHGLLSRYMLLTNSATAPSSITPAANITSAQVSISIPMQIDLIALVNYANDVFSWNCGYNFWARSCEKINCRDITTNKVYDNCSATSGLDGITWMPYTDSTIKNLGEASLAPALSPDDLDLNSSRTKGSSHKIFTSLNYSWIDIDDVVVPFLGIGAELELGKSESATANGCCTRVSLSQWGLWLRMGTEF